MKKTLLLLLLCVASTAMNAIEKIKVGTTTREIIAYAPKNLPSSPALLIACHGSNQDAPYLQSLAKIESVADTAKFVLVYANGEDKSWDISGTKDTKFMEVIIDSMYSRYHINKNRVYLTGFSMGGMFTYHCANKLSNKIAAFCPVSGYMMGGPNAASTRPVPILHTHGTSDDVCTYSPVQSHIDAWVKHNGCNTTPEVISHYPRSSSPASLKRYRGGKNGVEVAFLTLADKGHWWSMDTSQALTSVEVWNFCKRFALGPDAPEVKSVSPENNSFDLVTTVNNTFEMTFNEPVDCSKIAAKLKSASGKVVTLDVKSEGMQSVVSFQIPAEATVEDDTQTLTVTNAVNAKGGVLSSVSYNYVYGVQELGEKIEVDTIFDSKLYEAMEATSEGIPYGWRRVMTSSSGTKETLNGNAANCGGVRLKYFEKGGDFDAGFYLSARDQSTADLYYGAINNYKLRLTPGYYTASFNATYWSQGAADGKASFTFNVLNNAMNTTILSAPSLNPTGCLNENSNQKVTGSRAFEYDFKISANSYYILNFSMSEGWNSVVVGNIKITPRLTLAEKYKGGFITAINKARGVVKDYGATDDDEISKIIAKYEGFTSTSPTEYTAATTAINKAIASYTANRVPLAIESVSSVAKAPQGLYDISGRKINSDNIKPGFYILNGKKFFK